MRKDLCYFYPMSVDVVFDAFVQAAYQQFGKRCKADPYKTINFGLDYSFKYNMNGGSVTAHFMPYQNGTAVNLRYTMVQAVAGRYKKHAEDYTGCINRILGAQGMVIQLDVNQFLSYEANTPSGVIPQPQAGYGQPVRQQPYASAQPVQQPVQQTHAQPAPQRRFCTGCGTPLMPNSLFCTNCGKKVD